MNKNKYLKYFIFAVSVILVVFICLASFWKYTGYTLRIPDRCFPLEPSTVRRELYIHEQVINKLFGVPIEYYCENS
ncbi:hypothetical protein A2801_04345 [Candidatus Woesebacteria bacterium RIFCSPHIGHO2_01_FULL_41_10]|uniref:Uncharacterized protein n=1 Tax=Candidatus Woesebacteria bacterium RIFCSPHIGHO2_01_FULL_41_10 TaxID=1802500 RepID=A0A1F7YNQ5_9BACT|nr:MAG: hypothetical protein A2801_04345 [Candidatus Woesebacteria bacterium RIFCSPHIGHO2_01_FULL_41_10]